MTTPAHIDRAWLGDFASATRQASIQVLSNRNTCIATTRLGLMVLDHFGVRARPVAVTAYAENIPAAQLRMQGVPVDEWGPEAWSVGISNTAPSQGGGWNGHLVLVVRSTDGYDFGAPRVLVDLTADQFDRAHKGLRVPGPVLFGIAEGHQFTPQDPLSTITRADDGSPDAAITYRPMAPGVPEARQWRDSPDWAGPGDYAEALAALVIQALEERYSAHSG